MKKVHIIIPAIMLGGFCAYYVRWDREQTALRELHVKDPIGAPYVGRSGSREAAADLAAGRPRYLVYGEPNWEREKIARQRLQQIGITLDRVADCQVTLPLFSYVASYNAEITRAFGADAIGLAFGARLPAEGKEANQQSQPMRAEGPHG